MVSLTTISPDLRISLEIIKKYCIICNETIATAESVTAGAIQLLLSTAENASQFFQGGLTVYNCVQKAIHLGIDPVSAGQVNGVGEEISTQMAINVCALFRSQIGVGITGYAIRVPEEGINELYAHIAIVRNGKLLAQKKLETSTEYLDAQLAYAAAVIHFMARIFSGIGDE